MSAWFDCGDEAARAEGLEAASAAVLRGELVVLPTDTIYGLGTDAFNQVAVARLTAVRNQPPAAPRSVLVGTVRAASALVEDMGQYGQQLIDEFWPGALTIVCRAARTLSWDLGDTKGTVAVRMPQDQLALDLLRETGPMAVTNASMAGTPAATTAADARAQLAESVAVYLDDGPRQGGLSSTIIDLTGDQPRLLRRGAISIGRLREVAAVTAGADADQA
jgi:L-threonylcarbamoyladenylate synthase